MAATHPVTLDVDQQPVGEVIRMVLQGQGLDFTVRGGTVSGLSFYVRADNLLFLPLSG